jgi:hypothetical protein
MNSQMWLGDSAMTGSTNGENCSDYTSGTGSAYQANIKTIVDNATAAGVYVILDLLQDAPPGQCAIGEPGFLSTYATTFWQQVATAFGNNPAVIFDMFNEPYGDSTGYCAGFGSSNCGNPTNPDISSLSTLLAKGGPEPNNSYVTEDNIRGGGATLTLSYTVVGELELLSTIRATGATNLVLASPWWYAGEIELWPQTYGIASGNPDPIRNLGATMHAYGYDNSNVGNVTALSNLIADGYPLIITEFYSDGLGTLQDTPGYLKPVSQLITLGVSGFIGCCDNDWGGSIMLGAGNSGW